MSGDYDSTLEFEIALLSMDKSKAEELFANNVHSGGPIETASGMIVKALDSIGSGWEQGRNSLAQVYVSGRICETLVEKYLYNSTQPRLCEPRIAIVVLEDYHTLGKRIVISVLRSAGYEVIDFGAGLTVDETVQLAIEENVEILLVSVLMLPSALRIKTLVERLKSRNIKIFVGGAPFRFDKELYKKVGADGTGETATDILSLLKR